MPAEIRKKTLTHYFRSKRFNYMRFPPTDAFVASLCDQGSARASAKRKVPATTYTDYTDLPESCKTELFSPRVRSKRVVVHYAIISGTR